MKEEQLQIIENQVFAKEENIKEEKPLKVKAAARDSAKDVRETKDEKTKDAREEKDDSIIGALKLVAPGTSLREGLDSVLRAKTGGLIVIGDSEEIMRLVEGGFHLNTEYTPPNLYELAKMDGAIVLSKDAKRILYANAQLIPDSSSPSRETGIRHRTAERMAKLTDALVIAISQRRGVITLYRGANRYSLQDIGVLLSKANQAVQTLEKYKRVLDKALVNLTALEFEDLVTVHDVVLVVQRGEMVLRIVRELNNYISELGTEGRLIIMQVEELVTNIQDDLTHVVRDYLESGNKKAEDVLQTIANWSADDLLELSNFSRVLGWGSSASVLDESIHPRGYRILQRIPRLPAPVIDNLVHSFDSFQSLLKASIEELDEVEGIGEVRAKNIRNGLRRLQDQVMLERYM
ncbi:MAG: DNA integrity scanning diadenylate cyclase DisA [Syntrophaceticus sp.]|nr:DNA integrity scanning diadenylate cyclase DisA [Syntrophaceticus sp.]HBG22611.1 DNA integrity scanning protein DisA [Peptococcaceae bacterium]MDD3314847.1 DNA integrity scanning diadenylate cyclase DisA [Syntrophaceticus sp.]MDD4359974.1 DNA integrity scanning diadenylate cyclase DisA [Syntrophaceticus sp.]MDD4783716.1 DNA integrity scanning diadenylate cyclase DisA [Syntrophaceticus sp.]